MKDLTNIDNKETALFERVSELIEQAHRHVATTVNIAEVYTKYHIGGYIVEEEQNWSKRQLSRQVGSSLCERLALSRDKAGIPFLLEMGKGFLFEARQKRFTLDEQNFYHPTIGILLCERKNDSLVELTLPKDANIYASQYQLCLPDKGLLQAKLREWIAEFEENNMGEDGQRTESS